MVKIPIENLSSLAALVHPNVVEKNDLTPIGKETAMSPKFTL